MDVDFFIKCALAAIGVWGIFYIPHIAAKDVNDYDNDIWP